LVALLARSPTTSKASLKTKASTLKHRKVDIIDSFSLGATCNFFFCYEQRLSRTPRVEVFLPRLLITRLPFETQAFHPDTDKVINDSSFLVQLVLIPLGS
jgi:hypothetical protein